MTDHLTDTISRLYTDPGGYVDSDHPAVEAFARAAVPAGASARDKASRLTPRYATAFATTPMSACARPRAIGLPACLRPATATASARRRCMRGLPGSRHPGLVGFRRCPQSPHHREAAPEHGLDLFTWHGFSEVFVDGAWRKATRPSTTRCAKLGVKPLDFDGHSDALLHPFDGEGRAYMQYVNDHGTYHDVPAKFLMREMAREYANMQGEDMSGRDMEQEAAQQ